MHVISWGGCWYCGEFGCSTDFGYRLCAKLCVDKQICRHQVCGISRYEDGTYAVWTYWEPGTVSIPSISFLSFL